MTQTESTTVEVEHNDDTIAVPTEFGVADVATYFGVSEFPITVDRIFEYDGHVRAESFTGDEYVEIGYFPDGGHSDTLDAGWIADGNIGVDPAEVRERGVHNLGGTLWVREGVED
jgi:hypothetical protein